MSSLKLDLVFVLDATSSQGEYLDNAAASVEDICANILASNHILSPDDLRFGLIAFRDHPPQDYTYVVRKWDFTRDIERLHKHLRFIKPGGGGDVPEAVTAALYECLKMSWRVDSDCAKIVVLISDAPPHGIGSEGDGFPDGDPEPYKYDPLILAREMAMKGITLNFVACEPTLSSHKNAVEFYRGLTQITSGLAVPLTSAKSLATCIVGSALESLALEELIQECEPFIKNLISQQQPPSAVVTYLYQMLSLKEKTIPQLSVEGIYEWNQARLENVRIWTSADSIAAAKLQLNSVNGTPLTPAADRHYNPNKYVKISFKNTSDDHVKVTWYDEDGNVKSGDNGRLDKSLPPKYIHDVYVEVHEIQRFIFQQGRKRYNHVRAYTRDTDIDLAVFWAIDVLPRLKETVAQNVKS